MRLALVIPTFNEAGNIARALDLARAALDSASIAYELIVVDDGSADDTAEIVAAASAQDPRIRLIVRKGQRGLSGAILDGWRHSGANLLGVMDADLQHPPELLPALFRAISAGNDIAIGSRYTPGGGIGGWNLVRKLLSSVAVWATWPLQTRGLRAHDPMSGFFMVRRECVEAIPFQRAGFKLLLDILIRGRVSSLEEVPFSFGLRTADQSKANFRVGWDYFRLLARLYARKLGFVRQKRVCVGLEADAS